jgi:hypothetical protein
MLVNVYVDGFNLFYGCIKGTPYKWLDLDALSRTMLPRDRIHRIRYFTARVSSRPDDPACDRRQAVYLRALSTTPHLTVHLGRFQQHITRMPLAYPIPGGPKTIEVIKTEEKRSDVNLAAYMLTDAAFQDSEAAVMITNDADLAEPVHLMRTRFGVPVGIINPSKNAVCSRDLASAQPMFIKSIRTSALRNSQFPEKLQDQHGVITRPAKW